MAYIDMRDIGSYVKDPATGEYVATAGSYLADADVALRDYYKQLLTLEQGDVEKAKARLLNDYETGKRITMEDYTREKQYGQEVYGGQVAEQQDYNVQESRGLQTNQLQRGISQGGVAEQQTGELVDRQALRREAIDRALRKSEEDLSYGKERSLEDITKTQTRGTEDVVSGFAKFKMQSDQERKEKGMGLAESAYNRDLTKKTTEKSFEMQQKGLDMQRESLDWTKDHTY